MERRRFLLALAAGLAAAAVGRGIRSAPCDRSRAPRRALDRPRRSPRSAVAGTGAVSPPTGVVQRPAGRGDRLALTIDDGTSTEVVAAFAAFAADSGVRLTFFPNGCYRSWTDNAAALRPLVDSGQVAFGNHTWSHPDLTTLRRPAGGRGDHPQPGFLRTTFGVRDTPFLRPPYGAARRADRPHRRRPRPPHRRDVERHARRLPRAHRRRAAGRRPAVVHRRRRSSSGTPTTRRSPPCTATCWRSSPSAGCARVTLADVWATPAQRLRGASPTAGVAG